MLVLKLEGSSNDGAGREILELSKNTKLLTITTIIVQSLRLF